MDRMAIFVDGANCFYAQRNVLHWNIDWGRVLNHYRRDFNVVAARFYRAVLSPQPERDIAFGNFLRAQGFAIRQKDVKEIVDVETGKLKRKGNLDIELTIDALLTANQYDVCLLISGDGDFAPLAQALRALGKRVKVLSTRGTMAGELLDEVGLDYEDLAGLRDELEYKSLPLTEDPGERSGTIARSTPLEEFTIGKSYSAQVIRVIKKGAYVRTGAGTQAFVPASRLGIDGHVDDASTLIDVGDVFQVEVDARGRNAESTLLRANLVDREAQARIQNRFDKQRPQPRDIPDSGEFELQVAGVTPYGAFLQNPWGVQVLLRVNSLGLNGQCDDCSKIINKGERVRVVVKGRSQNNGHLSLDVELVDPQFAVTLQQRLDDPRETSVEV